MNWTFCPSSTPPMSASDTAASMRMLWRSLAMVNSVGVFIAAATV